MDIKNLTESDKLKIRSMVEEVLKECGCTQTEENKSVPHGSPRDRGSADAYYGRPAKPHWIWFDPNGPKTGERIEITDEESDDWKEYMAGYEEEDDRKTWE